MRLFRKKFFLTLLLVTFCFFTAGNAQDSSYEVEQEDPSSQDSTLQLLDDAEPVSAFSSLQDAMRNYDFESAWNMFSQDLRQAKFAGDVEIFKKHFENSDHYNALTNFVIEKTKFLNNAKIELIGTAGSGYFMNKEGDDWKFGGKNKDNDSDVKGGKSKTGKKGQGKGGGGKKGGKRNKASMSE